MSSSDRRERERLQVRHKILDAARELFATEGYDAVTMRRIAEVIEYSPTTIYLHFKDKDTLIREICHVDSMALAQAFHAIATEPDPLVRLRQIGMAYVDFGMQHQHHYRLMFMSNRLLEAEYLPAMGHGNPEEDGYAFLLSTIQQAIAQQRFYAHLTDPHLLAQAFWGGVHGIVALHLAKYGDPWVEWRSLTTTATLIIDSILQGIVNAHPSDVV